MHRSSRSSSSHSNSSAFSPSANPHEDWTKISDLAERRRIQNRIAQRNYRKKLKRRLEDLERRAGSSSASPERSLDDHSEPAPAPAPAPARMGKPRTRHRPTKSMSDASRNAPGAVDNHTNHTNNTVKTADERGAMFSHQSTRQLSASPPPVFSHASPYPHLDGYMVSPALMYSSYDDTGMGVGLSQGYGDPTQTHSMVPPLQPPAPPGAAAGAAGPVKRMQAAYDEEMLSPFSMSYATMAGIDLSPPTPQPLPESSLPAPFHAHSHSPPSTSPDSAVVSGPLTPDSEGFSHALF